MKRLTTDQFIERAKRVHGDKYDYSKTKYHGIKARISVICPEHGEFIQNADTHSRGSGCPECSGNKKLDTKSFISRAINIHGDKYNYKKVEYINYKSKVIIICDDHNEFLQAPGDHLQGKGCMECGQIKTKSKLSLNNEDFLNLAKKKYSDKYDYSKAEYKSMDTKVIITCSKHGDFSMTPYNHIRRSQECPTCSRISNAIKQTLTTKDFIRRSVKAHQNKYDYKKVEYINSKSRVIIICPKHGEYVQEARHHMHGVGCPRCQNKSEGRIAIYLNTQHITYRRYRIKSREFDFYLPDFNLIIERDGEQHYRDTTIKGHKIKVKEQQVNDIFKTKLAKKEGYKIARIPYWLTEEEEHKEIENILAGKPTYPDVPDQKQATTKPKPKF